MSFKVLTGVRSLILISNVMPRDARSHLRLRPESRWKLDQPGYLRTLITAADVDPDWFWDNVDKSGFCWVWTGTRDANGYGQVRLYRDRKIVWYIPATHVGLYLTKGILIDRDPENDIEACHLCDHTSCILHIEPRSHEANMRYQIKHNTRHEPLRAEEFNLLVEYECAWWGLTDIKRRHLPYSLKERLYSLTPRQYRNIRTQVVKRYIRQHWGRLLEYDTLAQERNSYYVEH